MSTIDSSIVSEISRSAEQLLAAIRAFLLPVLLLKERVTSDDLEKVVNSPGKLALNYSLTGGPIIVVSAECGSIRQRQIPCRFGNMPPVRQRAQPLLECSDTVLTVRDLDAYTRQVLEVDLCKRVLTLCCLLAHKRRLDLISVKRALNVDSETGLKVMVFLRLAYPALVDLYFGSLELTDILREHQDRTWRNLSEFAAWLLKCVFDKDIAPRDIVIEKTDLFDTIFTKDHPLCRDISESVKVCEEQVVSEQLSVDMLKNIVTAIQDVLVVDTTVLNTFVSSLACGNVLLVGKPGVGKTTMAKLASERLGYMPLIATCNAHWSRIDIIGGPMLKGGSTYWKSGHLIIALVEHIRSKIEKHDKWRGAWLIIDEINRADVDKAFSDFFTIFSSPDPQDWIIPKYLIEEISSFPDRDKYADRFIEYVERYLDKASAGYKVPSDFRVIGTLNTVDVRNLFVLGEAFARRFYIVEVTYPSNIDVEIQKILDKVCSEYPDVVDRLRQDYLTDLVKSLVKRLRSKNEISFGTAQLYSMLRVLARILKLDTNVDIRQALKQAVLSVLPLSRYWDEEVKEHVRNVIEEL